MKLRATFENQKTYKVATGTVFKEEFNETLDSCVLNITNVEAENKLSLDPYSYVYIYDEDSDFEKWFLIDNFIESYVNLDEPYYDYQINCFSETKLLEKIQLPNRTIRHTLVEGETNKTIGEIINEFCTLYIPKRKTYTKTMIFGMWEYQYIIDFSKVVKDEKFNVECPEMTFNNPTLREVLNSLMQVVGCLPVVKNYELSYIDLRAEPKAFITQKNRIYDLKTSNSSDSYLNSITTLCENVVGDNNIVKNEILGFRDKDNVFLKHTENLKLTTEQPIERINKLELCVPATFTKCYYNCPSNLSSVWVGNWRLTSYVKDNQRHCYLQSYLHTEDEFTLDKITIKYYKCEIGERDIYISGSGKHTRNAIIGKPKLLDEITQTNVKVNLISTTGSHMQTDKLAKSSSAVDASFCVAIVSRKGNDFCFIYTENGYNDNEGNTLLFSLMFNWSYDISSLVYESGKRKCLRTDLTYTPSTIKDLSQYYYTTLEYSYGGTTISGFSQKYDYVAWYGRYENILIANLYNVAMNDFPYGKLVLKDVLGLFGISETIFNNSFIERELLSYGNQYYANTQPYKYDSALSFYSILFFNIEYTPFNSLNLVYNKKDKDIPFNLTQLDNQETSIPSLMNFSAREQQKTNRIGNNVLSIHASQITDLSEVNDLNTKYNDSVIFSREIAYYDTYCEVNYVATKDYTLKNYFTSIATKYRAYEYVDYSQTTTRKENKKFYLCLDDGFTNGDDKIVLGAWKSKSTTDKAFLTTYYFLNFLINQENKIDTFDYNIVGTSQSENYDLYKNDLSIVKYANTIVFSYKDFDSVSAGIYINDNSYNEQLGGYIQGWYMRSENYNDKHKCIFADYKFYETTDSGALFISDLDTINQYLKFPKINETGFNVETTSNKLTIVDNNLNGDYNCVYYKSQDEVISETIQFEYCSLNDYIKVGNHLCDYKQQLSGDVKIYGYNGSECNNFDDVYAIDATKLNKGFIKLSGNDGRLRLTHKADTTFTYVIATNGTKAINLIKIDNSITTLCVNINDTKSKVVFSKIGKLYIGDKQQAYIAGLYYDEKYC